MGGEQEVVEEEVYGMRMLVNVVVKESLGGMMKAVVGCQS